MKKVKVPLEDLIIVLEAMRDTGGTVDVVIFEHNGVAAIADVEDQDNIISFAITDEDGNLEEDNELH